MSTPVGVSIFVLFSLSYPGGADAAVCSPDDLISRKAEKCAAKYFVALRKCVRNGTPLSTCDTSGSTPFCDQLSPGCNPKGEVDEIITIAYGDPPVHTPCRRGLATRAAALLRKRYVRARQQRPAKLGRDYLACVHKPPKSCTANPSLGGACTGTTDPESAAECLCSQWGCNDLSPDQLDDQVAPTGANTLFHARSLGYTITEQAEICLGPDATQLTLRAKLSNPAQSGQFLDFTFSTQGPVAILSRYDATGVAIFNESGGLHVSPDAQEIQILAPDGVAPPQSSQAESALQSVASGGPSGLQCQGFWREYVPCVLRAQLVGRACRNALAALATCKGAPPCLIAVWALCKFITEEAVGPCTNTDRDCEYGTSCSTQDFCFIGECWRGQATGTTDPCTGERGTPLWPATIPLPRCGFDGDFRLKLFEAAHCYGNVCREDRPPRICEGRCGACVGTAGLASCGVHDGCCGNGIKQSSEECDPGDPAVGIPPDDSDCRAQCSDQCQCTSTPCAGCANQHCGFGDVCATVQVDDNPPAFIDCQYRCLPAGTCFCSRASEIVDCDSDADCPETWRCVGGCFPPSGGRCAAPCVQCFPVGWPCNTTNDPYACCNGVESCFSDPGSPQPTCH